MACVELTDAGEDGELDHIDGDVLRGLKRYWDGKK